MAMFVHLTPESRLAHIRRNGIARLRRPYGAFPGGVFATPVGPSFTASHQWLRELKRRNAGPIAGVTFRVPDDEPVRVGHYNRAHRRMTAAEAVGEFLAASDNQGWEVVVGRRIEASEIHRTRRLPQLIGWRYKPGAHGQKPCGCDYCQRGQYGARKLRDEYNRE